MRLVIYLTLLIASFIVLITNVTGWMQSLAIEFVVVIMIVAIESIFNRRFWQQIKLLTLYRKELIRVSVSYLFRIKIDGQYLLVRGERIKDQFQSVGGVYKRFTESNEIFDELNILDDQHIPIIDVTRDDLRVFVPSKNVIKFFEWFDTKKGRETNPEREFREELLKSGILDKENFESINYRYVKRVETPIRFSVYFQTFEILVADIYELKPTNQQRQELMSLKDKDSQKYIWAEYDKIKKLGYDKNNSVRIAESTLWIL